MLTLSIYAAQFGLCIIPCLSFRQTHCWFINTYLLAEICFSLEKMMKETKTVASEAVGRTQCNECLRILQKKNKQ